MESYSQNIIKNLDLRAKKIFNRILAIKETNVFLKQDLIKKKYPYLENQKIIYLQNKVLHQEVILNISRGKRKQPLNKIQQEDDTTYDPFCAYKQETPIDELGRLENEMAVTAANLSKMADYHSLVIFKKHSLAKIKKDDFSQAWNLASNWFEKIKKLDSKIKTQILIWNYHFRAGASILHPHFQLLSYHHVPWPLKNFYQKIYNYQKKTNQDYFEDYFYLVNKLKIAKEYNNLKIGFDFTPKKEKGLIIKGEIEEKNQIFLWNVINRLLELGTESFNFVFIKESPWKLINNLGFWVDRGSVEKKNCDIGSLEIFLFPVISTDPVEFGQLLFSTL